MLVRLTSNDLNQNREWLTIIESSAFFIFFFINLFTVRDVKDYALARKWNHKAQKEIMSLKKMFLVLVMCAGLTACKSGGGSGGSEQSPEGAPEPKPVPAIKCQSFENDVKFCLEQKLEADAGSRLKVELTGEHLEKANFHWSVLGGVSNIALPNVQGAQTDVTFILPTVPETQRLTVSVVGKVGEVSKEITSELVINKSRAPKVSGIESAIYFEEGLVDLSWQRALTFDGKTNDSFIYTIVANQLDDSGQIFETLEYETTDLEYQIPVVPGKTYQWHLKVKGDSGTAESVHSTYTVPDNTPELLPIIEKNASQYMSSSQPTEAPGTLVAFGDKLKIVRVDEKGQQYYSDALIYELFDENNPLVFSFSGVAQGESVTKEELKSFEAMQAEDENYLPHEQEGNAYSTAEMSTDIGSYNFRLISKRPYSVNCHEQLVIGRKGKALIKCHTVLDLGTRFEINDNASFDFEKIFSIYTIDFDLSKYNNLLINTIKRYFPSEVLKLSIGLKPAVKGHMGTTLSAKIGYDSRIDLNTVFGFNFNYSLLKPNFSPIGTASYDASKILQPPYNGSFISMSGGSSDNPLAVNVNMQAGIYPGFTGLGVEGTASAAVNLNLEQSRVILPQSVMQATDRSSTTVDGSLDSSVKIGINLSTKEIEYVDKNTGKAKSIKLTGLKYEKELLKFSLYEHPDQIIADGIDAEQCVKSGIYRAPKECGTDCYVEHKDYGRLNVGESYGSMKNMTEELIFSSPYSLDKVYLKTDNPNSTARITKTRNGHSFLSYVNGQDRPEEELDQYFALDSSKPFSVLFGIVVHEDRLINGFPSKGMPWMCWGNFGKIVSNFTEDFDVAP